MLTSACDFLLEPSEGVARRSHRIKLTHLFIPWPPPIPSCVIEAESKARVYWRQGGESRRDPAYQPIDGSLKLILTRHARLEFLSHEGD
jgi:hypothetical protein